MATKSTTPTAGLQAVKTSRAETEAAFKKARASIKTAADETQKALDDVRRAAGLPVVDRWVVEAMRDPEMIALVRQAIRDSGKLSSIPKPDSDTVFINKRCDFRNFKVHD